MKEVEGVVIALYKMAGGHPRFAVLRRDDDWEGWELPKGRLENGETPQTAAQREIKEETGIEPQDLTPLDDTHEWDYERNGTQHHAVYHAFMARAPDSAFIDISDNPDQDEHSKGHFLNTRDTRDILTHDNQRNLIDTVISKLED